MKPNSKCQLTLDKNKIFFKNYEVFDKEIVEPDDISVLEKFQMQIDKIQFGQKYWTSIPYN